MEPSNILYEKRHVGLVCLTMLHSKGLKVTSFANILIWQACGNLWQQLLPCTLQNSNIIWDCSEYLPISSKVQNRSMENKPGVIRGPILDLGQIHNGFIDLDTGSRSDPDPWLWGCTASAGSEQVVLCTTFKKKAAKVAHQWCSWSLPRWPFPSPPHPHPLATLNL